MSQTDAEVSHLSRVPARWRGGSLPGRSENHGMWHGAGVLVAARGGERIGRCGRLFVWLLVYQVHLVYKCDVHFWRAGKRQHLIVPSERRRLAIACLLFVSSCAGRVGTQRAAN